jgi:hypothetical protein
MVTHHPVFEYDGTRLSGRLSRFQVVNGQALAGEPLDLESGTALDALEAVMTRPDLAVTHTFEAGQIQFVNNRQMAHHRTAIPRLAGARAQAPPGATLAARHRPALLQRLTAAGMRRGPAVNAEGAADLDPFELPDAQSASGAT